MPRNNKPITLILYYNITSVGNGVSILLYRWYYVAVLVEGPNQNTYKLLKAMTWLLYVMMLTIHIIQVKTAHKQNKCHNIWM